MFKRKPKVLTPAQAEEIRTKDFFDCILPGTISNSSWAAWTFRQISGWTKAHKLKQQAIQFSTRDVYE